MKTPPTLRVLFFGETPHRLAGAQRSLLAALGPLRFHDIEPHVLFPAEGVCVEAFRAAGLSTAVLPGPPALTMFDKRLVRLTPAEYLRTAVKEFFPYARSLARLIEVERYDAVHFNTPRGILEGGVAAKLARVPAVLHLRGAPLGFGRGYWLAAQALADAIILVAHALESSVQRLYRGRCTVVYNGVDVPPLADRGAARAELARQIPALGGPGTTVFVSLSSFTPFKGIHHLLEAAALLKQRGAGVQVVLAGGRGDDRYEEFIEGRRAALGLSEVVHTCGPVSQPLLLLAAADALVLPSITREQLTLQDGVTLDVSGTEGLPRSVLEAMSVGLPVIASRVQGVVEQVEDDVSGLIVPPGNAEALAAAMARVAADPVWCVTAGARGREIVKARFTVEAAARGLADVLRSV